MSKNVNFCLKCCHYAFISNYSPVKFIDSFLVSMEKFSLLVNAQADDLWLAFRVRSSPDF